MNLPTLDEAVKRATTDQCPTCGGSGQVLYGVVSWDMALDAQAEWCSDCGGGGLVLHTEPELARAVLLAAGYEDLRAEVERWKKRAQANARTALNREAERESLEAEVRELTRQKDGWLRSALETQDMRREETAALRDLCDKLAEALERMVKGFVSDKVYHPSAQQAKKALALHRERKGT